MNKYYSGISLPMRLLFLGVLIPVLSFTQSINFRKAASWQQLLQQAAAEKKLVFVDVYTKWCGPCKLMADQVFTLPEVSNFYNASFVNYQLDAEEGEGIELKKKYDVQVYPTYLFIDPATGAIVHKSTSRQEPKVFLYTGQSALQRETRSTWLEQQYRSGQRSPQLVKQYSDYLGSCYQMKLLDTVIHDYLKQVSYRLTDTVAWYLFNKYRKGSTSPDATYLLANRESLSRQYGVIAVDNKIREMFEFDLIGIISQGIYNVGRFRKDDYQSLMARLQPLLFPGKQFLLRKSEILDFFRQKKYKAAGELALQIPADTSLNRKDVLSLYKQLVAFSRMNNDLEWIEYAINFARYIACNDVENSPDAFIHYQYASLLEKYIELSAAAAGKQSALLTTRPAFGENEYRIHNPGLLPKPKPAH